jgi:hypothetical protein
LRKALVTLLLLGAAITARAGTCTSCEGGTLDEASGFCLPASVEGLPRVAITAERTRQLKAHRNSVAAGYDVMRYRLAVTLHLYDRDQPGPVADDDEMAAAVREVLDSHKDARLEMGGATSLPVAGEATEGQGALLTWQEGLTDYVSLLWLLPQEKRWLKVGATYVRPLEDAGEAADFAVGFVRKVASAICTVR